MRRLLVCLALATVLTGCLWEPKVEDGWTRLDMESSVVTPVQPLSPGASCSVSVRTAITYRDIVTGFAVTELRATGVPFGSIRPDAPRMSMAQDIDALLANSVGIGRSTRAITGWDHLIQRVDARFAATVPTSVDTSAGPPGSAVQLFLVAYLAEGEEVELPGGGDTLIITPFISTQREILPMGIPIVVGSGTP